MNAVTFEKCNNWSPLALYITSGDGEDDKPNCKLYVYAFGFSFGLRLPTLIRPIEKRVVPNWDAATVARLGRDYYIDYTERRYGFMLSDGHLSVYLGRQSDSSDTEQRWSCFLPWTQWRFVRFSLYNPDGSHFWTQYARERRRGLGSYDDQRAAEESCPSVAFEFDDHDGQRIVATTQIHEREWLFGEGWFKWLSLFRKPKVCRSLDLKFSSEVGPEKGSWKGGTLGHGIDMQAGESCETAFRRYCEQEHRSKYRPFKIKFVGLTQPQPKVSA